MTGIVVSRRDGVLTAPDGTKYRVARGKTLAHAEHPAVLANPGDWVPMVITLVVEGGEGGSVEGVPHPPCAAQDEVDQLIEQVAELEETLVQRDAELTRLADGYASLGHTLPAEDDRDPGWLVDLVLHELNASRPAPAVAPPPKPRKRATPPPRPDFASPQQ